MYSHVQISDTILVGGGVIEEVRGQVLGKVMVAIWVVRTSVNMNLMCSNYTCTKGKKSIKRHIEHTNTHHFFSHFLVKFLCAFCARRFSV